MIRENKVGVDLPGSPRWWTVRNGKGSREVVRACFERGRDYHGDDKPAELLLFVLLPTGAYAFPPLLVAALKMGGMGLDSLKDQGAEVWPYDSGMGRKLELMLCGVR